MKIVAKADFISVDFGNVKQGQQLKANKSQADQLVRLGLVDVIEQPAQKKKGK